MKRTRVPGRRRSGVCASAAFRSRISAPVLQAAAATAAALLLGTAPASGTDKTWIVGAGNWSFGTNWSPSGAPQNNDRVFITNADGVNRTVTLDVSSATLSTIYVDNTSTGTNTLSLSANTLTTTNGYFGAAGRGTLTIAGGTVNASASGIDGLYFGYQRGSAGTGSITSGSLNVTNGELFIGYYGTGTFTQSGGSVSAYYLTTGYLGNGTNAAGSGTYNMNGGGVTVSGGIFVGWYGNGTFNHSAGTVSTAALYIGSNTNGSNAASVGTYSLTGSSAALTISGGAFIGSSGSGTFTQSNGSVTANSGMSLGASSTGSGTYQLTGGTLTVSGSELRVGDSGTGTFVHSAGTNTVNNNLMVGAFGSSNSSYTLSSPGNLVVNGISFVGYSSSGVGTFTQSGGKHTTGQLILGNDSWARGVYNLTSPGYPTLAVTGDVTVGASATGAGGTNAGGIFNQTTGSHTIGDTNTASAPASLYIGRNAGATGAYNQSGGTLTVNGATYVGYNGIGTFTQSGSSSHIINGKTSGSGTNGLILGFATNSAGAYSLDRATLDLNNTVAWVGNRGQGTFNQTGGTVSVDNTPSGFYSLILGVESGSTGTYTIQDYYGATSARATLTTSNPLVIGSVGAGQMLQTGADVRVGTAAAPTDLLIGARFGGSGIYTMANTGTNAAGSLIVSGEIRVGDGGTGTFNHVDGVVQATSVRIANSGTSTASYSMTAGASLTLTDTLSLGGFAAGSTGIFNQTTGGLVTIGGGSNVGTLIVANGNGSASFPSRCTYNLGAGHLTVNGSEYVGSYATTYGIGTFNQTGGVHTLANGTAVASLMISRTGSGTSVSSFNLSGTGILNVDGEISVGERGLAVFNHSAGNVTVDSAGATPGLVVVGRYAPTVGTTPGGTYNLSGNASLTVSGNLVVGQGSAGAAVPATGLFNQTGGTLSVVNGQLQIAATANAAGTFTLNAPGAYASVGTAYVGGNTVTAGGVGTLNIQAGTFSAGALKLYDTFSADATSAVNLSGGTLSLGSLDTSGNPYNFNWTGGTLRFNNAGFTLGPGGPLGASLTIAPAQSLIVDGSLHLIPGGTLTPAYGSIAFGTLNQTGGTINGDLTNPGTYNYSGGALAGRLINQGTVNLLADFAPANGVRNEAAFNVGLGRTLSSLGPGIENLGNFTLTGGTLAGSSTILNDYGGSMSARGSITPAVINFGALNITGVLNLTSSLNNYGTLSVPASANLSGGTMTNRGIVTLSGGGIGTTIDNRNLFQGAGLISGSFVQNTGGIILANGTTPLSFFSSLNNAASAQIKVADGSALEVFSPWNNAGQISLLGPGALLSGDILTNTGTIEGAGTIANALLPNAGAIRATTGRLLLTGSGLSNAAAGQLYAGPGATLAFSQGLLGNSGSLALSGGTFDNSARSLSNAGSLTADSGTNRILAPIANTATGKLIVTGGATATFYYPVSGTVGTEIRVSTNSAAVFLGAVTGPVTFSGSGIKYFEGGQSSAGAIASGGATVVDAAAGLAVDSIQENSLTVSGQVTVRPSAGSPAVNRVSSLTISPGGKLDLTNNAMIVDYATGDPSPAADLRAALVNGRTAAGTWTGTTGLTSSSAAARPTDYALGYAEASAVLGSSGGNFLGQTVDGSAVLVRYTLAGDTNLDGAVNFIDLVAIAQHYNQSGAGVTWATGDTNYDGAVDFVDLVAVAQHYNQAAAGSFASDWQAALTSVPEPSAWCMLALAAALPLCRRARKPLGRPDGK